MKNFIKIISAFVFIMTCISCDRNTESLTESQIKTTEPILSDLDVWLIDNFVTPYNIDIRYQWSEADNDVARFLYPPLESSVMPIANLLKKVWIEPYNALGGKDFIANNSLRQFVFSGGFNYNPNSPTINLGFAEAGARITMFNIDYIDFSILDLDYPNFRSYTLPIKTLHHEYGHVLNQNFTRDPAYGLITASDYTGQWFDFTDEQAQRLGFISNYARNNIEDDFVEMIAEMLMRNRADYDALINGIVDINGDPALEAQGFLRQKEAMIVEYYQSYFGIDFYELQELTSQALKDLQI